MHIIIFPDKRTLAAYVDAQDLDEGIVYWKGATEYLVAPPVKATEPQLVKFMEALASKTGGVLQEVPRAPEPPAPKEDTASKITVQHLDDEGKVEVTEEIHPNLLFSANKSQKINVVDIRVKDVLPQPPTPIPECLAGMPLDKIIGQKLEGTVHTFIFETPISVAKGATLEIEGDPNKYVIQEVLEKTRGNSEVHLVKASSHSAEPFGYRFEDPKIRDWFLARENS